LIPAKRLLVENHHCWVSVTNLSGCILDSILTLVQPTVLSILVSESGELQAAGSLSLPVGVEPNIVYIDPRPKRGSALMTALDVAKGRISIFYASEVEPGTWERAISLIVDGLADVVYGAEKLGATLPLAVRTSLLQSVPLRSMGSGLEAEIAVKLQQRSARMVRIPVAPHNSRTAGFFATAAAKVRFRCFRDAYRNADDAMLDALAGTHRFNAWMADIIRPYKGEVILEIGCGIGNLTRQLLAGSSSYFAVDIDDEKLVRLRTELAGRKNLQVAHCDLSRPDDLAPYAGRMDTVVCLNVLEHIQDDAAALQHIKSALAPGGTAIVLVPEGLSIYGTLDEVLGHCRRYSEEDLRAKAASAGFEVERIIEFNRITRPAWFVNGRLLKRTRFSRFQLTVFDRLVWIWRRLDSVLPWKPTSLILIARKT
jgi:2-polyprenyl-3-methyl-5-hydroxy-6-metoxy-1,4-benzoquinol methylase